MATEQEGVTRQTPGSTTWALICGKPGCDQLARHIVEFSWVDGNWDGILGACNEHREDIGVVVLEQRKRQT